MSLTNASGGRHDSNLQTDDCGAGRLNLEALSLVATCTLVKRIAKSELVHWRAHLHGA